MNLLRCFGIGSTKITEQNHSVEGIVIRAERCWWLKINTKPVRTHPLDGAVFPHIIYFTYTVDGVKYNGSRYVSWSSRCPGIGEKITVYYEPHSPAKYAVSSRFGPALKR